MINTKATVMVAFVLSEPEGLNGQNSKRIASCSGVETGCVEDIVCALPAAERKAKKIKAARRISDPN
jgi:signal recognition particle GTPase